MIDYGRFIFATPPRSGVGWFVAAASHAGLGKSCRTNAYRPFGPTCPDKFRLSLARHPCDWLASCWISAAARDSDFQHLGSFRDLDATGSLDLYVRSYLATMPGRVSETFQRYEADSVLRIEDMPEAFDELLDTFAVESKSCLCRRPRPPRRMRGLPDWDPGLRREVLEADKMMADAYDYF